MRKVEAMSYYKLIGLTMVFGTSAWAGFGAAARVRSQLRQLEQLRFSLELMRTEIECRLTPLRKLSLALSEACTGEIARFFAALEQELRSGSSVAEAVSAAETACRRLLLPEPVRSALHALMDSFGEYDYAGQLRMIELTQAKVLAELQHLEVEKAHRCKCYELLGICTGLAAVILIV